MFSVLAMLEDSENVRSDHLRQKMANPAAKNRFFHFRHAVLAQACLSVWQAGVLTTCLLFVFAPFLLVNLYSCIVKAKGKFYPQETRHCADILSYQIAMRHFIFT